jgi:hypothetical protein
MEGMSVAFERTCTYDARYENAKMINWPKDRYVRLFRSGCKYEFKTCRGLNEF